MKLFEKINETQKELLQGSLKNYTEILNKEFENKTQKEIQNFIYNLDFYVIGYNMYFNVFLVNTLSIEEALEIVNGFRAYFKHEIISKFLNGEEKHYAKTKDSYKKIEDYKFQF